MTFWAHSGAEPDFSDWQPLPDHLKQVAERARRMAAPLGLSRLAEVAGLFHDLGKYDPAFQRRLTDPSIRVEHSTAGGAVLTANAQGRDRATADLLAYAILGHHADLPDRPGVLPSAGTALGQVLRQAQRSGSLVVQAVSS